MSVDAHKQEAHITCAILVCEDNTKFQAGFCMAT